MSTIQTTISDGYYEPGLISEALARWDDYIELPLENPTEEEVEAVDRILAAVLQGLESPPLGWHRLIYSRWAVHCMLRQYDGSEAKTAKMAAPQLACHCELIERLKSNEAQLSDETKRAFLHAVGAYFFGMDRINVNVVYWRTMLTNTYALEQSVGPEVMGLCFDYYTLWFWDARYREALKNGRHCRVLNIIDTANQDFASIKRNWLGLATLGRWMKTFPGKSPGPIDGIRYTLVRNFPPVLKMMTRFFQAMLPAGTFDRVRFFTPREEAAYREALAELVPLDQVPRSMLGGSDEHFALDGGLDRPLY